MKSLSISSEKEDPFDNAPLVSVVIPLYKHATFIHSCLWSVYKQNYPRIELIVIDDCSPDESHKVATQFIEKYNSRFERVIVKSNGINRGAHFSLNRGIALAKGDLISFINSDDTYVENRLNIMVAKMLKNQSSFAFSSCNTIDENNHPYSEEVLCHKIYWRPFIAKARLPSLSWGLLWRQLTATTGNVVLTRKLAMTVGPFADFKYCHDWDFVLRASFYAEPLFVPEPLYNYRVYDDNSFRALNEYAEPETKQVIKDHFQRVMLSEPPNLLAAAPQNWPSLFDSLIEEISMREHYNSLYQPYRHTHRTVCNDLIINQ